MMINRNLSEVCDHRVNRRGEREGRRGEPPGRGGASQ